MMSFSPFGWYVQEHPTIASHPGNLEIHCSRHAEAGHKGGPVAKHIPKVIHLILELGPAKFVSDVKHERLRLILGRSTQMVGCGFKSLVRVPTGGNVIIRVS